MADYDDLDDSYENHDDYYDDDENIGFADLDHDDALSDGEEDEDGLNDFVPPED